MPNPRTGRVSFLFFLLLFVKSFLSLFGGDVSVFLFVLWWNGAGFWCWFRDLGRSCRFCLVVSVFLLAVVYCFVVSKLRALTPGP